MEHPHLYNFSHWFIEKLGDLVREGYHHAADIGVSQADARRAIKLAFSILGRKQAITTAGLNIQLGKQKSPR